jgi:hypothetical protein
MQLKPFTILSPTAILGYGYPLASFERGLAANPDLIAVDAGSTDPGPYYLGSGKSFTDRTGVKRDLRPMLKAGIARKIPVIIGTAGGSGARPHVEWTKSIIEEIAREEKLTFKMAIIWSDVPKDVVLESLRAGKISPLGPVPELTEQAVFETPHIVTQIGVEPYIRALDLDCDVILAGRSYDPAVFAALPIKLGYDPGLSIHCGKILECAAIAATPGSGAYCILGTLYQHEFVLRALSPERKFTVESTAAHSLYEKSDPVILPGPGGHLDLTHVHFEQRPGGEVAVSGSRFIPSPVYRVKLEGARPVGFRTMTLGGIRDPIMIAAIGDILEAVRKRVDDILSSEKIRGKVFFHIYGRDGVMGEFEPLRNVASHEIGVVLESLAPTQEEADTICSVSRSTLLHYGYPGRIATAGNVAFPFSPSDVRMGAAYEFSLYHLMDLPGQELFPIEVVTVTP